MKDEWAKMGVKTFMREFLSGGTVERLTDYRKNLNPFKDMPPEGASDEESYEFFVEILNESGFVHGHRAAVTDRKHDRDDKSKQKPVVGLFREEDVPEAERPIWHAQVLHFDFERASVEDDLLNDEEDSDADELEITTHVAKQFQCQQRCFVFSVGIFGHRARLFRWDRSGGIISNSFDYTKTRHLCDFLYQFSQLSAEEQGYDPTAVLIAKDSPEAALMREVAKARDEKCGHVRQYFQDSLDEDWPWWKLAVRGPVSNPHGASAGSKRQIAMREYLVGKPRFMREDVVCRGTRGYVAIDCESQQFVWLKDVWRVDNQGTQHEGDILQLLNDLEIKNVPTVLHQGDVRNQRTVWPKYGPQLNPSSQKKNKSQKQEAPRSTRKAPKPLKWHRHYRLVVKEVCRPLSDFRNSRELLSLLWHCLAAHKDVMENAGFLHCDLSSGNLMLYEYEHDCKIYRDGMLCDWELAQAISKRPKDEEESPPQADRMGTWQFMSVHALNNASWSTTIQDELESFYYVLLWFAVRYLRHSFTRSELDDFIHHFFDSGKPAGDGVWIGGGRKRLAMESGIIINRGTQLKFKVDYMGINGRHPFNTIVEGMLMWFRAYYSVVRHSTDVQTKNDMSSRPVPQENLRTADNHAQNIAASLRRVVVFDTDTDEALAKEREEAQRKREEAQRKRLAEDQKLAQNLASHATVSDLWASAICLLQWPEDDRQIAQMDFDAGEQEGKGKLKCSATAESGAALVADAPTRRTWANMEEGKSKRRATIEPEGPEEYTPGRRTRAKTAKGKSKRRAPTGSESLEDEEFDDEESQGKGSQDEVSQDDPAGSRTLANIDKRTSMHPITSDPANSALTLRTRAAIGTNARTGRSRHHVIRESEELEDEREEPVEESAGPQAQKGKLKRVAAYENEGAKEDTPGRSTRSMTAKGRSKLRTTPKPANNTARQRAQTTAETGRSQRGAASEQVGNATRSRTRPKAGTSRSQRGATPEPVNVATRLRTRATAGTGRSKRPAVEPEHNDAPKSKRTRRA